MKNAVLMNVDEPTDKELIELMHEVAQEAINKALIAKKQLAEKIVQEISKAQSKLKAKRS